MASASASATGRGLFTIKRVTSTAARIQPRPVHVFALQALALTLLIGLWPTPKQLFPPLFHAHANDVFSFPYIPFPTVFVDAILILIVLHHHHVDDQLGS